MQIPNISELEERYVWGRDYSNENVWIRRLVYVVRTLILLVRDFFDGYLNLRAMSLVYTTLLSLVPLLALSFSLLKGFGIHNRLEGTVESYLAPLGAEKSAEIAASIISFVDNMNVRVLGAIGLAFLVFTVISLMQKIESAFNDVWRVQRQRSFGERFTTFISALTIGPLLVFSAVAITASMMNTSVMTYLQSLPIVGDVIETVAGLSSFVFIITAFTFLYHFIPNTRVRFAAALTGGCIAGGLWEIVGFGFATFASGASNYQAVYATFASAIFFLIWLYVSWLILLVGASVAFYHQHPEVVYMGRRQIHLSAAFTQEFALSILGRIGNRFYTGESGYTLPELAREYQLPGYVTERVLDLLADLDVLAQTDDEQAVYLPNVPFESTSVSEVVNAIAEYQPQNTYQPKLPEEPAIAGLCGQISHSRESALAELSLKDLALNLDAGSPIAALVAAKE
jgi:membrane protein